MRKSLNDINEFRRTIIMSSPVSCAVSESNGLNLDISVRCSILYDYKIHNRVAYYRTFGLDSGYGNEKFEKILKIETDQILQIAFAKIAQYGISLQQLQQSGDTVKEELAAQLFSKWESTYGVKFCDIDVSEISASPEDTKKIQDFTDQLGNMTPEKMAKALTPWICSCGEMSNGRFCPECGKKRPETLDAIARRYSCILNIPKG